VKRFAFSFLSCAFLFLATQPSFADATASATSAQPPVNDFAGQIMSNGGTGRVGIGTREPAATLDVYQGEVKIGSTGAACTSGLAGALRYANSKLQLCDGAGWRNVSLDKAQ
jgi:hypothetical protein